MERLLERSRCLVGLTGEQQHLREVGIHIALAIDHLRIGDGRRGLARKTLGFRVVAATRKDLCLHAPPIVRRRLVGLLERSGPSRPRVRLVQPVERVQRVGEVRCRFPEETIVPKLLVEPAALRAERDCREGIAGQELDGSGLERGQVRQESPPAALRLLRPGLGDGCARLLESPEPRQRPSSIGPEELVPPCNWLHSVEPGHELRDGGCAGEANPGERPHQRGRFVTGPLCVSEGSFVRLERFITSPADGSHQPERGVCDVQGQFVGHGLEQGKRLLGQREQLRSAPRLDLEAGDASLNPCGELADAIARNGGALRESVGAQDRFVASSAPHEHVGELVFKDEVDLGCGDEHGGALEEARGGLVVLAAGCTASRVGEALPCGTAKPVLGQPELRAVAARLLEVVAEDLVELDESGSGLLEPGREALVEVGAARLRDSVVGGVSDEQVAEAEAVLTGERRPVRPDQLLSRERGETRGHAFIGRQCLHSATVEDLALDRAVLEHASLGGLELVEPRGEQRLQRRRDDHLAFGLFGHGQHLGDEERVAARGVSDPLAQVAGEPVRDQLVDRLVDERRERQRHRPRRAALDKLRPRHADQQDRRAGREQRDVLDEVSERLLAHWMSSRTTASGCCAAACSSVLRTAHAISSPDDVMSVSPSSARIASAAASSGGDTCSCFRTSTTGQYVIPSPYGGQRPRTTVPFIDARASATSRDFPTPASPRMVTSSHCTPARTRSHVSRSSASSCSRPTSGASWRRSGASPTRISRYAGTGFDFPFSASGSTGSTSAASAASASVGSPTNTSPGCAACSSRAATFTASPVASRSSVPVTTSPVVTPIRPSSPSSGSASRISTAARNARSASSSRTTGTPNTAITASPMNFSTLPPCRSTIAFIRSKYRASSARSRSGSSISPRAVEPARSQNRTVTVLRCSCAWTAPAASGEPHCSQNLAPSLFSCPQLAQISTVRH